MYRVRVNQRDKERWLHEIAGVFWSQIISD